VPPPIDFSPQPPGPPPTDRVGRTGWQTQGYYERIDRDLKLQDQNRNKFQNPINSNNSNNSQLNFQLSNEQKQNILNNTTKYDLSNFKK
jgi:hypothetical protein